MHFNKLAALTLMMSAAPVQAESPSSPAFTAFQKVCANPKMTPKTVRLAVESAGGTVFLPEHKLTFPFQSSTTVWNVSAEAHKFSVTIIDAQVPVGHGEVQQSFTCTVTYDGKIGDEDAKSELRQWVGFAPDMSFLGMESYHLEWDGQVRTAVPAANADADSEAGKVWRATVSSDRGLTLLRLERSLKAMPNR